MSLDGARVLVVGASAGIGRAFAELAVHQGAVVAATARRADRLAELPDCLQIVADIARPDDCRRIVDEAVAQLGLLDIILHAAGTGSLAPIEGIDAALWAHQYAVNVVGPTSVTAAALPHLAPHAVVSYLSSTGVAEPRWGLSAYCAAKAAVDATIRSWRVEHPCRRFQRVVLGATIPTEFNAGFEPGLLARSLERWTADGIRATTMQTDNVGAALVTILGAMFANPDVDLPDVWFEPRGEQITTAGHESRAVGP